MKKKRKRGRPRTGRNRESPETKIVREVKAGIKPRSKANIDKARRELFNRTKPSYNLHQVQDFNPDKFARVVDKCLKGEAVIVGTGSGE